MSTDIVVGYETVTITVRREDAMVFVLGPFEAAVAVMEQRMKQGGSLKRMRQDVAVALGMRLLDDEPNGVASTKPGE
jgi:hypothetical protein